MMKEKMITGVLPALITPMDEKGNVKTELAETLVDFYMRQNADGLYMLGWTGEGAHLTVEKRKIWTEAVLDAGKDKLPVFVHVGYNEKLEDSVELAAHAAGNGAYAVSSVGISENATLEENVAYFKRISDAAPDTPFYVYWTQSGRTLTGGASITPEEVIGKLEEVPTFRGFKFTDTNFYILDRFKKYRPDLNILTGADELAVCSQLMGADGNIGALQAVTCYHHKVMFELGEKGDYREAKKLQHQANEVTEVYCRPEIGGIPGLKLLLERIYGIPAGFCAVEGPQGGYVVPEEAAQELVEVFRKNILVAP